jgi:hypothetical protein
MLIHLREFTSVTCPCLWMDTLNLIFCGSGTIFILVLDINGDVEDISIQVPVYYPLLAYHNLVKSSSRFEKSNLKFL